MKKKWLLIIISIVITVMALNLASCVNNNKENTLKPLIKNEKELAATLEDICRQYQQPAMACALVNSKGITIEASAGTAVYGENQAVNPNSRFHIGSTTKSMTAMLIQMLVNEEKLSYETTLEQVFPDIPMRPEYRNVTINQLLLHQAGIIPFQLIALEKPNDVNKLWVEIPAAYTDPVEQRREVTRYALSLEPVTQPGTKAIYSNVGYAIAGHVVETLYGKPYETVIQEKIFKPLGMNGAKTGGWPASKQDPGQPRGHYPPQQSGETPKPQDIEDAYTFPAWMNPSGGVHCTITDFALYVMENLKGLKGRGILMDEKGYLNIHSIHLTAKLNEMYIGTQQEGTLTFGYGWAVVPVEGGNLSAADGSGGTFYATIIVYPALDTAFAGFTNCGSGSAALNEAIKRMTGMDIRL